MGERAALEPLLRPWALCLAALVPLGVYVFTTGAHSYWLDSGEFTAAAVYLDIAHPPGHPLTQLWSKAFALLPLGPLPFRVAFGQAVASSLSLALLSVAFARTLNAAGLALRTRELVALAGTLVLAGSHAYWFQSVRQEVYALQALLLALSLERLTASAVRHDEDPRPLYAATLALGLGLSNHHFVSVLGLPALGLELFRLTRRAHVRPWLWGLALGALGFVGYLYLPIRASTRPPLDLGHPVTFQNLAWVISAQVYARHIGLEAPQPIGERFADLFVLIVENFTFVSLWIAALGAYHALRTPGLRRLAYVWGITALVSLAGRPWLGPVRSNPDVLGYMMPGFAALVALALLGVAALLTIRPLRRELALCTGLLVLAPLQFARELGRSSLARFHGTDDLDDARRRMLPEGAVVVLVTPESVFRHWEGEAVERLRPDVTLLPVPFLGYGDTGEVLAERLPELAPVIRHYLAHERLDLGLLLALARTRPVVVEADASETLGLYTHLLPAGPLYRLQQSPPSDKALAEAAARREVIYARLYETLGDQVRDDETLRKLLWIHYTDALYFAFHGALAEARRAATQGLALAPTTRELQRLDAALRAPNAQGRLDVRPFLVGE